ncbi:MAG TPA: TonB-dependent siderophore receptor [Pseudomonadales bacterium]
MKNTFTSKAALALNCGLVLVSSQAVLAADAGGTRSGAGVEEIIIKALRADRETRGATGLDLSPFETPQSLTVLEAEEIANFRLVDVNSMLKMTTGVNVDSTETDRTTYNSRGFDITSMHVDGIGIPFGSLIVGDLDTAIYEKVEVLRGSNGLITGLGNPSGTVNYVRKRPGNESAIDTTVQLGRWNNQRVVTDLSTPLTSDGRWAIRAVGVYQDKESWLDHYANERKVGSFVLDGQIGDSVTLAVGYTHQDNDSDGVLWGAAPIIYSNGVQADWDESTSTSMDWTFWNTLTKTSFAELGWRVNDNITVTSMLQHSDYTENAEVFYTYWNTGLDPATGLGMLGYPGKFDTEQDSLVWDTVVRSTFTAWGREHQFNIGLNLAEKDSSGLDATALSGFDVMPPFPGWRGNEVARPTWDTPIEAARDDMQLNRLYGSLLLAMTDNLNLILGASKVDYENRGVSWGVSTDSDEDGGSPYAGFTWEVLDGLNVYGSYSDIYQPQFYLDESLQPLGSAEGKSYEFGVKKQFANMLASVAVFRSEQENLQEFVAYGDGDGVADTDFADDFDFAMYRGIDAEADGIELELSGNITDTINVQAGYTHLKIEDPNGNDARTFIPRNTLKVLGSWAPAAMPQLGLGLSARWQDDMYFESTYGRIAQDSYAVFGGYVSYAFNDALSLALNVDNLTDEKYLSSVKYEQSWYAQPLDYSLSLRWKY